MRARGPTILLLTALLAGGCTGGPAVPESPGGEITGTVTYRERIALPPGAVIRVRLADVSRQDVAADVLAEADIPTAGRQVPIPFRLAYRASRIDPARTYAVSARILVNERLRMISTTTYPVLTRGAPDQVEIEVSTVGDGAAAD